LRCTVKTFERQNSYFALDSLLKLKPTHLANKLRNRESSTLACMHGSRVTEVDAHIHSGGWVPFLTSEHTYEYLFNSKNLVAVIT